MVDKPNKPSFLLVIVDKENKKHKTFAGAVFDGRYNMLLVLNPGIVIDSQVSKTCYLNLVPYEDVKFERRQSYRKPEREDPDNASNPDDEDIPF